MDTTTPLKIKALVDENGEYFSPVIAAESMYTTNGKPYETELNNKLEAVNLISSDSVTITKDGKDCTFEVNFGATDNIIDNLDTTVAGQGPLDARQGNVLKNLIPGIVDNLTTNDASKTLSARQGVELKKIAVPTGGSAGQVLKKATDANHSLEWGDAADPNAIVGDGSIMKIIELTYAEYKTLESNGELKEDTEYHITDVENGTVSYKTEAQIQDMINSSIRTDAEILSIAQSNVVNNLTSTSTTSALSAAMGANLEKKRIPHVTGIVSASSALQTNSSDTGSVNNGYSNNKYCPHTLREKSGVGNSMSEWYGGIHIPNIEQYSVLIVELNFGGRAIDGSTAQISGGIILFQGSNGTEDSEYGRGWQNYILGPTFNNYNKSEMTKIINVGNRTGAYVIGSVWSAYQGQIAWNSGFGDAGSTLRVIGFLR